MSAPRSVLRLSCDVAAASGSRTVGGRRSLASQAASTSKAKSSTASPASGQPTVYASLLLSRPPLITPTQSQLESTYYNYTSSVQHALSNPPSQTNPFYFKPGSLPLRRFQQSQHQVLSETYGSELAGSAPDIGDVPAETPVQAFDRDHWVKQDAKRGDKSLERFPEQEVFCVVKDKSGKWEIPRVKLEQGESLDDAVGRIRGVQGWMEGRTMDSWLVTRKPIGSLKSGQDTVRGIHRASGQAVDVMADIIRHSSSAHTSSEESPRWDPARHTRLGRG